MNNVDSYRHPRCTQLESALRITRSCSNLIETLYLYNLSELPIANLIFVDCSSLSLHPTYSCPQQHLLANSTWLR